MRSTSVILSSVFVVVLGASFYLWLGTTRPIRVGVLHSLSGDMAISESSLVDAVQMAVEELNEKGGVLGRQVVAVTMDGESDAEVFAEQAERLLGSEKVSAIFGCWTSACRRTVRKTFEKHNGLLFYPVQYEGIEQSPNIVYSGPIPNQQAIPAVRYSLLHHGKRFFLVGSNYVFPRTVNIIIANQLKKWRGTIVAEAYVPFGLEEDLMDQIMPQIMKTIALKIKDSDPDVILNSINGKSNQLFFEALDEAGVAVPTMSLSIAEDEIRTIGAEILEDHYVTWTYFQSIQTEGNKDFVSRFKARYGQDRVTDDPIEAAYFNVHLWAHAVNKAGSEDVDDVRDELRGMSLSGPGGMVHIDEETQNAWNTVRIGKIQNDGQIKNVWNSKYPVRPIPYPEPCTKAEWDLLLDNLNREWGNQWTSPLHNIEWVVRDTPECVW